MFQGVMPVYHITHLCCMGLRMSHSAGQSCYAYLPFPSHDLAHLSFTVLLPNDILIELVLSPNTPRISLPSPPPSVSNAPLAPLSSMDNAMFIHYNWECETRRRFGAEAAAKLAQHRDNTREASEDEMRKYIWEGLRLLAAMEEGSRPLRTEL